MWFILRTKVRTTLVGSKCRPNLKNVINLKNNTIIKINDISSDFLLKAIKVVDDLCGPRMIRDSVLITKDILKNELNDISESMALEFDNIIDFSEEEIKKWLFNFVNVNEDQSAIVAQLQEYAQEIKEEIFNQRVKKGITIPPLKYYIE